jgi:pyrroline-5-carboxylate reductase
VPSIEDLFKVTKTIMVCVKPQDMQKALTKNAQNLTENHLVLSIAAGTVLSQIEGVN